MKFTHQVAVLAYLFHEDRMLLLKRVNEPSIWGPPGGHLEVLEDPVQGLLREIREETGLEAKILLPSNTWQGEWNGRPLLSIDYLAWTPDNRVRLSAEHSNYYWISLDELRAGDPIRLDERIGVPIAYFEFAFQLFFLLRQYKPELF